MGFLDKARAAANDLAAKADTALASSGLGGPGAGADRYFHDLGVLAFLEAEGRGFEPEERARVLEALRGMDSRGEIRSFALHTATPGPGSVPPPPGAAQAPPPPGASSAGPTPPAREADQTTQATQPATAPPPPPPSWASKDTDPS
jgi:hypothetical protein